MRIIPRDSADTENELYNFTISQNNGETVEKIVRYTLEDGAVVADEGHTEVIYSKGTQSNCTVMIIPCEYGNYHQDGSSCIGHGITIIIKCGSGGGTTGGDGPTGPTGGDGPTTPTGPGGFNPQEGGGGGGNSAASNTPCAKTKTLIQENDVKSKMDDLYSKSKIGGEKAFMMKNDGTPGNIIDGEEHSVTLSNMNGHKGVYHNHTPTGIKMVSVIDIYRLFDFIVKQPNGSQTTDAFIGMVGSEPCGDPATCQPDGYEYFNYIVRFSGTAQQAGNIYSASYNFDDLKKGYQKLEAELREKPGYSSQNGKFLSFKGLEELFFNTIGKMGIDKSKMILQRIDRHGNVTLVTIGTDGKPRDTPCP